MRTREERRGADLITTSVAGALAVVVSPHHLSTAAVTAVARMCAVFADIHGVATTIAQVALLHLTKHKLE